MSEKDSLALFVVFCGQHYMSGQNMPDGETFFNWITKTKVDIIINIDFEVMGNGAWRTWAGMSVNLLSYLVTPVQDNFPYQRKFSFF